MSDHDLNEVEAKLNDREIYVACIEYEGGQAAFSTLEKAIEYGVDYVAKWRVDGVGLYDAKVVWRRDR